jgi:hypothetical protein
MAPVDGSTSIKVNQIEYRNWKNALSVCNDTVRLIVLTDVGPRVLFYGFIDGPNEFHEVSEHAGLVGSNVFRTYGGHRLWVSPEVEHTYYPDNVQVCVSRREGAIVFTAGGESAKGN